MLSRAVARFRCLLPLIVLGFAASALAADAPRKPNVVFILCDDLGYGDVKCLNPQGKIATPNLDKLAQGGVIFTDAHSGSAVCTPTRYGVITGRYCWRSKLQSHVLGGLSPRLIEPDRQTVADFLKQQGYYTGCVGKWHLGMDWVRLPGKDVTELRIETPEQVHNVDYSKSIAGGPTSVGFDEYFGISASLDMVPYTYIKNDRVTVVPTVDKEFPLMTGRPATKTRLGPATPDFEVEDVLPMLTSKAVEFIQARAPAARQGKPFFLYLPLNSPHTPIAPSSEWLGKSGLNPYADFVMQTDASIGQVMQALADGQIADDTLIVVTSDNGCSPQAKFDELLAKGHNPSYVFRGNKADIYDGGHRVPFIARWPAGAKAGTRSDHLVCLTDLLATCSEILGTKLPDTMGEDSISFLPGLTGAEKSQRTAIVHHSIDGSFAIREGNWKLELCPGSGGWSSPKPAVDDTSKLPLIQLFDLSQDINERKNLADEQSAVVARLTELLEQYVANGRSTPGAPQSNTVAIDIWKAGKEAHQPKAKKRKANAS